jgi:hypothetical protein
MASEHIVGMRAGPPFTDILVAARVILRDQQYTNKDQRRLMVGSQEKSPEIATF